MSRLLFAAARGARIQLKSLLNEGLWQTTDFAPTVQNTAYTGRIHPDDLHLAYGPISTALRKQVATLEEEPAGIPYIQGFWDFTWEEAHTFDTNVMHRSLFLLILAEALADEGL